MFRNPSFIRCAALQTLILTTSAGLFWPGPTASGQSFLVASSQTDSIKQYRWPDGAYLGDFVAPGSGGLDVPFGITLGPGGDLFVASWANNSILRYDGLTGAFEGAFVPLGGGGLVAPWAIAQRADGDLLVSHAGYIEPGLCECIKRFDDATGSYMGDFATLPTSPLAPFSMSYGMTVAPNGDVFVAWASTSTYGVNSVRRYSPTGTLTMTYLGPTSPLGGIHGPFRGLAIGPNGNLFAAIYVGDSVLQFNTATGAFINNFVGTGQPGGGMSIGGLDSPEGIVFAPNGNLLVTSNPITGSRVLEYNGTTGAFVRAFVPAGGGGLNGAAGVVFRPDTTPPCPADLNGDGVVNGIDLGTLLAAWAPGGCGFIFTMGCGPADLNGDGVVNGLDLGLMLAAWGPC